MYCITKILYVLNYRTLINFFPQLFKIFDFFSLFKNKKSPMRYMSYEFYFSIHTVCYMKKRQSVNNILY